MIRPEQCAVRNDANRQACWARDAGGGVALSDRNLGGEVSDDLQVGRGVAGVDRFEGGAEGGEERGELFIDMLFIDGDQDDSRAAGMAGPRGLMSASCSPTVRLSVRPSAHRTRL